MCQECDIIAKSVNNYPYIDRIDEKLITKKRYLTRYALLCGYVHLIERGEYRVKMGLDDSRGFFYISGRKLGEARQIFLNEACKILEVDVSPLAIGATSLTNRTFR